MADKANPWQDAFAKVRSESDFAVLHAVLEGEGAQPEINTSFEWDGAFLTPLFIAVLLRLDDFIPKMIAIGADPGVSCLYSGLLCCPVQAAAVRDDADVLRTLLEAACDASAAGAETSTLDAVPSGIAADRQLAGCNALHLLIAQDSFVEEVYLLLLSHGAKLSATCRVGGDGDGGGEQTCGLALPRHFKNKVATEEVLDGLVGQELKHTICSSQSASAMNSLLDLGQSLKRQHGDLAYRFARDVDFTFSTTTGNRQVPTTALLYAADKGNGDVVRLLLYAGADGSSTMEKALAFSQGQTITLQCHVIHLAALRADGVMLEQLTFFGIDVNTPCSGEVCRSNTVEATEAWQAMNSMHLAVLAGLPQAIKALLKCECSLDHRAQRFEVRAGEHVGAPEFVSPLLLAVRRDDIAMVSVLLDTGAHIDAEIRNAAHASKVVCEMFGGPSVVTLEDWLSALLSGEAALQNLLDRRTDLSRALDWPEASARALLEQHRLASPELIGRLLTTLESCPSILRSVRPVHLACMLQQPWALGMLVDAGVSVKDTPPCLEVLRDDVPLPDGALSSWQLDAVSLCVRVGALPTLELLVREPRFGLDVRQELALVPDITPAFFPRQHPAGHDLALTWAWRRMSALEMALLHRRVDVAVLLVRLGADLLHTVDHVAVRPPEHYSVTDFCFRGLTPLHLCALLDMRLAATALVNDACKDVAPVVANEHPRPQRQALLSATCAQVWATVDTDGDEAKEPWLWKDLTPLHLAMLMKNYDVAEFLIEVSSPQSLALQCSTKDVDADSERATSALLLAYEKDLKGLHRKIAKKFPTC